MSEEAAAPAPVVFNLNNWKQKYCNEDVSVSIPWFFEHFDNEKFSIYFCKYKYELNQPMRFMVSNLVGCMIQRLDKMSRFAFASLLIFGNAKPYEIEGIWVFEGQDIPEGIKEGADFELFDYSKMDITNEDTKKVISEFLAWEGDFNGRKDVEGFLFK
ncbi:Eukaryotic translation elongation factor 1 gamma [Entamoeba marina]